MVNEDSWQVEWNIIAVENSRDTMRSVFNEAQSDDTLRQVGGVFYTDRYCALIFTYLLRSAAPDDRASTRAHRTEPFHLIFHLNFRSTSKTCASYTDNCFPTNTRTSSCAGSTRSAGFPSFYYVLRIMNVSARCIPWFALYCIPSRCINDATVDLYSPITVIHKFTSLRRLRLRNVQFSKDTVRGVGEPEKEIDFTRDAIRLSRPFSKLISRRSNDTLSRRVERPNSYLPTSLRFSLIHYASSFPSITWITEPMNFVLN